MCDVAGFWSDFEPSVLSRRAALLRQRRPESQGRAPLPELGVDLVHTRRTMLDLAVVVAWRRAAVSCRERRPGTYTVRQEPPPS